jgi:hypothetical protein
MINYIGNGLTTLMEILYQKTRTSYGVRSSALGWKFKQTNGSQGYDS